MSKVRMVVAYDDWPDRYNLLVKFIAEKGWAFACVEHPAALTQLLDTYDVVCVMLDHDVRPLYCGYFGAGLYAGPEPYNGADIARHALISRDIPVIITSINPEGAKNISNILTDYQVPHLEIPATHNPEYEWMNAIEVYAEEE